jgi:hypothetical protein
MNREYFISANRRVIVFQRDCEFYITIEEIGSEIKSITLPIKRWAALLAVESNIDHAVNCLQTKQYVKFSHHIGGAVFVSLTTGYQCVDIRSYFYNKTKACSSPTKRGIALNLDQWLQFKEISQQIKVNFPQLAKIELCLHANVDTLINCVECHPFKDSVETMKSAENSSFYYQ